MRRSLRFACLLLFAFVVMLTNGVAKRADADRVPVYLEEFLERAGIPRGTIKVRSTAHKRVPDAIRSIGLEASRKIASSAKDDVSGAGYFRITEDKRAVTIERHYPLEDEIREPAIYLIKNEAGQLADVAFSEGVSLR